MQVQEKCLTERVWYDTTKFRFKIAMTAIAIAYTRSGFAIAADSRATTTAASGSRFTEDEPSDKEQKIVRVAAFGTTIAYGFSGFVAKTASYDLKGYAEAKAPTLASREFRNGHEYGDALAQILERYLCVKKREGIIQYRENLDLAPEDRMLIATIYVIGYCRERPFWLAMKFDHEGETAVSVRRGDQLDLIPGACSGWGSDIVPELAVRGDRRFDGYKDRLARDLRDASLDVARDWVSAYIEVCSEPLAEQIDPICKNIGGPPHIATVIKEHGFEWVVPPINVSEPDCDRETGP